MAATLAPTSTATRPSAQRPAPDDLLVATARGDRTAFHELYAQLAPTVMGLTRRILRSHAMAEEVAQEVFTEVWQKAGRFDPERGTAAGWIGTLARRRAIDRVRSEQSARDRDRRRAIGNRVRPFDVVADAAETADEHARVRAALVTLTEVQREAIRLAYFEGHTYREVAEVLGIPEGTAKSRLRDGLRRLTEALA